MKKITKPRKTFHLADLKRLSTVDLRTVAGGGTSPRKNHLDD